MTQEPIVTVRQGQLRGKINADEHGRQYVSFQGIPYAKPPIGELRFKAPQHSEPWTGILDATSERSGSYSRHIVYTEQIVGSEDCLFLNIYTPELPIPNNRPKPVMLWIHGGGFTSGSGSIDYYNPELLLAQDVVIVTINYRLGLLGFLCLDDTSLGVPGNAGLKDQVMALKWVQQNIDKFNGDPNNVTIFGVSAGGAAVHCLMLSPMAKGLFHRAICQSGCALSCWVKGQRSAPLIAKALQLGTADEKVIFKILKEMPVEKIFETQEKIPDRFIAAEVPPIGIVIENPSQEPAFLSKEILDIMSTGQFTHVPLMIGYTSREGMLSEILTKFRYGKVKLVKNFEVSVPHMMKFPKGSELSKNAASKIKQFFYGDAEPSLDNIDQYYLLQTDNFFLRSIYATLRLQVASSPSPIYLYRMSLDSTLNIYKRLMQIEKPGACHADDLGYLFKTALTPEIRPKSIEDDAVKRFTKLWTTFARNGDPNPTENSNLINVTWQPVEKNRFHFLDIGENLTVGINPEASRMEFWDDFYKLSTATSKL